jgi:hypothetical protein
MFKNTAYQEASEGEKMLLISRYSKKATKEWIEENEKETMD